MRGCKLAVLLLTSLLCVSSAGASDWEEGPSTPPVVEETRPVAPANKPGTTKLQGQVQHDAVEPGKGKAKSGGVLDRGPADVMPETRAGGFKKGEAKEDSQLLEGKTIDDELRGMVNDGSLKPLEGLYDKEKALRASAAKESSDPDEQDQELMVEWDRWRNRFMRAVQLGVQEMVNNPDPEDYERPRYDPQTGRLGARYPMGTGTAFSCMITRDGRILHLEVIEPSGFSKYDRIVLKAVRQLEGTRLLNFPKMSQRSNVTQAARIKTAATADFQYHKFGDVERVRSPQQ